MFSTNKKSPVDLSPSPQDRSLDSDEQKLDEEQLEYIKQEEERIRQEEALNLLAHKPRDYILKTASANKISDRKITSDEKHDEDEWCFYVLGCAGTGEEGQRQVARLMNQVAGRGKKPKYIILLGDNFYDCGVDEPRDEAFQERFYQVYHAKALTHLAGTPCFVIPGNHDHNLHNNWLIGGKKNGDIDFNKIAAQIRHTYLDKNGDIDQEKVRRYQQSEINLVELDAWNMQSRYGSKRYQDLEMFFADSNTYVRDYLAALVDPDDADNQANWLGAAGKKNKGTKKILCMHHPLYTSGKRATKSDAHLYLSHEDEEKLAEIGIKGNYNEILREILLRQNLVFDSVFAAHDHGLSYSLIKQKGRELCQVISGGGGEDLQDRQVYDNRKFLPCYLQNHGFTQVTAHRKSKELFFDLYTIDGHHLRYSNKSTSVIVDPSKDTQECAILRNVVLSVCEKYLEYFYNGPPQDAGWKAWAKWKTRGNSGAKRAYDLINYFNCYDPLDFNKSVIYLRGAIAVKDRWTNPDPFSLVTRFDEVMQETYGLTQEQFFEQYEDLFTANNADVILHTDQASMAKTISHPITMAGATTQRRVIQDRYPFVFGSPPYCRMEHREAEESKAENGKGSFSAKADMGGR